MLQKYAFLYAPKYRFFDACVERFQRVHVNVIYKLMDSSCKHSYPPLNTSTYENFAANIVSSTPARVAVDNRNNNNNSSLSNSTPHRTVSHYGYNCPLTNCPNILLHPANQSICQTISVHRNSLISFIDQTSLSNANRRVFNALSKSSKPSPTTDESTVYVTALDIQLEPLTPPNSRTHSSIAGSANDSLDELISKFKTTVHLNTQATKSDRDEDTLYPCSYTSRLFLPKDKSEASQGMLYENMADSGLGGSGGVGSGGPGGRQRLTTTSNDSSSSSPEVESQFKLPCIDILINISLRNSECAQTVQEHELEFRSKLEKVIDAEIHYISQQLGMRSRAPLSTPTSSTTHLMQQRSNSAPALCHSYSYVDLVNSEVQVVPPSSSTTKSEPDALQNSLNPLEIQLKDLLNNIIRVHEWHNRAFICECRALITQLRENVRGKIDR